MRHPSRLRFLFAFYAAVTGLFLMSKPVFMLMNTPEGRKIDLADCLSVLWHGLPLDLATAGYLSAPLWLALSFSVWVRPRETSPLRIWSAGIYVLYIGVVSILLSVILVADCCLYGYWGIKLDGTVLAYLDSPKGAAASVSGGYVAAVCAAVLILSVIIFFVLRRLRPQSLPPVRRRGMATLAMTLAGGLMFLGMRGGTGKSTANVGMVYFSADSFLNHSAVNPAFSIFSSLFKTKDFARQHDYYSEEDRARIFDTLGYGQTAAEPDTLLTTSRPNVLVILLEGLGGTLVSAVDTAANAAITPHVNRLAREGIFFSRCYANSFRTDRGTLCALSGYPSFPDVSVMKLPAKCAALPSIAGSLRRAGYATSFLYGGDINFTNTNGYLLSTGYERTFGEDAFTPAERATHNWGVTDHITFDRLYRMVTEAPVGKPWHIAFLTLASHEPWQVPYGRIKGDEVANAFAYLGDCLGRFIARFRQTMQWRNTLVVILPDHGSGYPSGLTDDNPRKSHIPMIWTGGAVRRPLVVDKICNQSDLPATLLGAMGLPHGDFRFSRNVMSRAYKRPSAVHTWSEGIFWLDDTGLTVINLLAAPQRVMLDTPRPSAARSAAANAFLQTAYDDLGALGS